MKVAVSIPDDTFRRAEGAAKLLGTSRSNLYARALDEFVERHTPDNLTAAINAAIEAAGDQADAYARKAARDALAGVEWSD